MNDHNFLETLADRLNQNASVKNVFGEPVRSGDKVIIPVAQVILGMGGGFGQQLQQAENSLSSSLPVPVGKPGTPGGGGGGMSLTARGVYEITPERTRFIPAYNVRQLIITLAAGFLLGRLFAP